MRLVLQNFILFQIGWFACVLGGASDYSWVGSLTVVAIIAVHLMHAKYVGPELRLILYTLAIGTLWDSLLTVTGLLQFHGGQFFDWLAPHWLIAMWALFATTLNVSMRWLQGRVFLAFLAGLIGGPLAYYAGHKLGAVNYSDPVLALSYVAVGWSIIMPLLSFLASKNDGYLLESKVTLRKQEASA